MHATLSLECLRRSLEVRDLTDPAGGPHAMQALLEAATGALTTAWGCALRWHRLSPVVSVADNYDRLHYPPEAVSRDTRYTRYLCEGAVLRTQTSAMVPSALRGVTEEPAEDVLLACPGLVYRRDSIDRLHTGEPHQVDLWRIRRGRPLGEPDLRQMVDLLVAAVLLGREWRATPTAHPYTLGGLQVDARQGEEWVEVAECGLALPALLAECGLPAGEWTGLALGMGLDRALMLRKGVPDIRLLRSADPRVAAQMLDLAPYRPVSHMPAVRRDLSLAVEAETTPEELGDRVRAALGCRADMVEAVEVLSETPGEALPPAAAARLGLRPGQKNLAVRLLLRALDRTLTHAECNELRDEVWAALHRGSVDQWAGRRGQPREPVA